MKKTRRFNYSKTFKKQRFLIALFMGIAVISMSIGYALYNEELRLEGEVAIEVPDEVVIYSLGVDDMNYATLGDTVYRTTDGDNYKSLDSELEFDFKESSKDGLYSSYITYLYEIVNLSSEDYTYSEFVFSGDISNGDTLYAPIIDGISAGDVISSRETKYVKVTYYYPSDLDSDISLNVDSSFIFMEGDVEVAKGDIATSIDKTNLELNDSNMADVNIDVMNLFDSSIIYDVKLSNSDVSLTNSSGTSKSYNYIINSGATNEHHVYLKVNDGVDVSNDIITDIYILTESGKKYTIATLTLVGDPRAKYSKAVVDYTIEAAPSWEGHYFVYFNITNNDTETMEEYTAYLYLDDSITFTKFDNYNSMILYDHDEHVIKISSKDRWSDANSSIASGETFEFAQSVIGMDVSELKFKKIVVYKDAETYTDGFNYQA